MSFLTHHPNPYTKALFKLGKEEKCLQVFKDQLDRIGLFLKNNPPILNQFSNPFLTNAHHLNSLKPVFHDSSPYVVNFIKLLAKKKRLSLLPTLIKRFDYLCQKEAGILTAHVQSATSLSLAEQKVLREKLASLSHRSASQIMLSLTIDPTLLAGLQIYMPPYFVDASLRRYLHKIDLIANDELSP